MRLQGRLTEWNDERGFGFITPLSGEGRIFVHVSEFSRSQRRPIVTDLVTYVVEPDERGRPQAYEVAYLAPTRSRTARPEASLRLRLLPACAISFLFLGILLAGAIFGLTHWGLLVAYFAVSAFTFLAYGFDKLAAERRRWRTSESQLHLCSLLGGWPGALIAQPFFHHKTVKQPFQTVFWFTVFGNLGLLALLLAMLPLAPV